MGRLEVIQFMRARLTVVMFMLGLVMCFVSQACGPFFPYAYFAFGRERDVLELPESTFFLELCRVLNTSNDAVSADDADKQEEISKGADVDGLMSSLKDAGISDDAAKPIIERYRNARTQDPPSANMLDANLPREFQLYAEGAAAYHADDFDGAVKKWNELLALPAEQRKYKSVWAAYMVGRALRDTDAAAAGAAFEHARALAAEGFPDPLNLAAESIGWEGYIEYQSGNGPRAIQRYAEQFKLGKAWSQSADASLRLVCSDVFSSADTLAACAKDETARAVVTAWAVSHPSFGEAITPWLSSLLSHAKPVEIPQADLLAWAAYGQGDFDSAQKLLDAPSAQTPTGKVVRYKLLLHDGKVDEAMTLMQEIAREAPEPAQGPGYEIDDYPPPSSRAELAVLQLGKQQYVEAFGNFLREKFWYDAAYIGDRVLTTDELKQYVDSHADDPIFAVPFDENYENPDVWDEEGQTESHVPTLGQCTRYMLGRRLARDGRWPEAIGYLPPKVAEKAKQLLALREAGKAGQPPTTESSLWERFVGAKPRVVVDRDRAAKLEEAATLTRESGMDLLGTEVQPDWHVFDGSFELASYYDSRVRWEGKDVAKSPDVEEPTQPKLPDALARVLAASADELRRVQASAPGPDRRFHYRYVAADLMWQAAQMLPNNDVDTMYALYTGGSYLKTRDPLAANKFYRALVWRNLNMPYAKEADKLRWFPEGPPK